MTCPSLSQCVFTLLALLPFTAQANTFYVAPAPAGSSSNTGSISSPWDLPTALAQPSVVKPGDTIWLRGGVYSGPFVSSLNGNSTAPIIVRQYPGERATLQAPASATDVLTVNGSWTWYWGFEVMCPDLNRYNIRTEGIGAFGPNVRFINLVVHDNGQGFGFWQPATDSTIYGSIIYNNGYEQPDRGHGHSIYTQNQTGTKHILDNIFFQSFSEGIQEYGSSAAGLNNYDIEGNIAFNHGIPSATGGAKDNLLIGGGNIAQNQVFISNYTYYPSWAPGRNDIGYASGCNNATITGNYFAQPTALNLNCTNVTMTGNTLDGTIVGFTASQFPSNTYVSGNPAGVAVFVRPNVYEPGRANIVVFNWDHLATINVDVSKVLTAGQSYVVQDVQNFFGPPVAAGTYNGGTIPIPTGLTLVAATVGTFPVPITHTAQEFNAYVLLPVSGSVPKINQPPVVSAGAAQTITLPASAALSGSATDDGLPSGVLTLVWSAVSGPGTVTFSTPNSAQTTATFSAAGTYVLQLSANDGSLTTTGQVTITVNSGTPGGPSGGSAGVAQFVKTDSATQGNWKGVYGSQGAIVIGDTSQLPSGVSVAPSGQSLYTWVSSTTDVRALIRQSNSGRLAATWYAGTSFNIDLNVTDGVTHQFAIYCLDWDNAGPRAERIDVIDAGNNAVLDTRNVGSFVGGQYLVWNIAGHVIVRVTVTAGANPVISGLFWDGAGTTLPPPPVTTPPPPVTTPSSLNSAQFVALDTTTKGSWKGVYGGVGATVIDDASNAPSFAVVQQTGAFDYVWTPATTDTRALSRVVQSGRIAATWFSSLFSIDVAIQDGLTHQLALYCVDWDTAGPRSERIDIIDPVSGTILDTRTVSSFVGGQYLVWNVSGHVTVRFTTLQGANSVVSGLFWNQ